MFCSRFALLLSLASGLLQAQTPPALRLPDTVRPTHYTLDLRLVPTDENYSGSIAIEVELKQATNLVWLHGTGLQVSAASAKVGESTFEAKPLQSAREALGLQFSSPLAAGKATLRLQFSGVLNKTDVEGLFKQVEAGSSYILTQFEPTSARRAFPCFDEPQYKVPWKISVHTTKANVVAGNTPIVSEKEESNGMKLVQFAESKPLPSYLVALAVGPFDVVDGGKGGRNRTPLRILAPKGRGPDTGWATEVTPKIMAALEKYFGIPYPFEKLDQVTIPVTVAFGAMENAGLITYQQSLLVAKPSDATIANRRTTAEVIAHELAHQWFGNMVTPVWWDDIWLNEAFATWTERKIITGLFPEWHVADNGVEKYGAMAKDSLLSARKIRQQIESEGDIGNAFDSITYQKGSAVIRMFENYLTDAQFQKGVQSYMKKYAWGNATATDFLSSISAAAGRDIAPAFNTFLNRGGVPLLLVDLQCPAGGPPKVTLAQERFLPLGSSGSRETYWQMPVCVEFGSGATAGRECQLIADPRQSIELKSAKSCPAWVNANADAAGYYHVLYGQGMLAKIASKATDLNLAEKVDLVRNATALIAGGQLPVSEALELASRFKDAPEQELVGATVSLIEAVRRDVPQALLPKFAAYVRGLYGTRARQLGWTPKPGEDANTTLLRKSLIHVSANFGDDPELVAQAKKLADGWLKDSQSLNPDMADLTLMISAAHGDRAFFDKLVAELKMSSDRRRRRRLISAISAFRDPAIASSALELNLAKDLDVRETSPLLSAFNDERSTETVGWTFLTSHFDELLSRLPTRLGTHAGSELPAVGTGFCSEEGRKQVADFFAERIKPIYGGERTLAETLEKIHLCQERRAVQSQSIAQFLSR